MNAEPNAAPEPSDALSESEHFALELRWYEGRMLPYAEWVGDFVARHRDEILGLAGGSDDPAALLTAAKRLIQQRGSLHMAQELQDQKREIQNELWYRGEKGEFDRRGIQQAWTAQHAAAWRRWRIKEYLFVANRCAGQIVAILQSPPGASDSASPS